LGYEARYIRTSLSRFKVENRTRTSAYCPFNEMISTKGGVAIGSGGVPPTPAGAKLGMYSRAAAT